MENIKNFETLFKELHSQIEELLATTKNFEEIQKILIFKYRLEHELSNKIRLAKDFEALQRITLP